LVPNIALEIEQEMVTNLANTLYVSFTSDTWTSKATENYEAFSAHFIDQELKFQSCTLGKLFTVKNVRLYVFLPILLLIY
jgi:hypothetical protein